MGLYEWSLWSIYGTVIKIGRRIAHEEHRGTMK